MPESRIENLRRRVEADPTSIAFAALAEEYRRLGRFQDAVEVCRRGLERHPAYLSARVTLGRALLELNELDEARQQLDEVLRIAPENLAAIRGRAEIHQRLGGRAAQMRESVPNEPQSVSSAAPASFVAGSEELARLETFLQAIVAERQRRGTPDA